jgi:phenylalanyl-tRNA synthetase beta chain
MLISRAWLGELLAGTFDLAALSDDDLTRALTGLGLEVEGVRTVGGGLEHVVVGEVVSVKPPPGADRLRVVEVHDGEGTRTIVCGASNVPAPGGRILFARPGATLPGGMQIAAREVRGVHSEGMICSETELDIGSDGSGIVVLDERDGAARAGQRIGDAFGGIVDTIIELSVTPNRPDALGHVGVARDLAVKLGTSWRPTALDVPEVPDDPHLATIEAPDGCGRYFGVAFEGGRVGPSPLAARVRLHRLGLRPLSNAIDITNLVLMQWGQPLHVFDRAQLQEGRVVVRRARAKEPLRTLDGRDLELDATDLVIADATRPLALAGVMGGALSGIADATSTFLLEAAWFQPAGIRRSARRHGMSTDSSHRFERGVDHGAGLEAACAQACRLLQTWCGATPIAMYEAKGERPRPRVIAFRPSRCAMLLGMEVPAPEMKRIFDGIGVEIGAAGSDAWPCLAPTHRPDLEREVDLVDEVVRHHGLDRLPMAITPPSAEATPPSAAVRMRQRVHAAVTDALREQSLHEVVSSVFTRPESIAATGDDPASADIVRLANPMRTEASLLRVHLLPGLLDALAVNVARYQRPVALFEHGRVYRHGPRTITERVGPTAEVDAALPEEPTRAAVLLGTQTTDERDRGAADPRRVGAALLHVLARIGASARLRVSDTPASWLHPGAQAELVLPSGTVVGRFGRVHPRLLAQWDLPRGIEASYGELLLEHVPDLAVPRFTAVPRFPRTSRDVSFDVAITVPVEHIIAVLARAAERHVPAGDDPPRLVMGDRGTGSIELVEDYRAQGIAAGRRALLLRMHYGCRTRSMTDAEVQPSYEAAVEAACEELRAADPKIRRR